MSGSPTNINLNDTNPPAQPDSYNVTVQAGAAYPDTNSPGNWVRDTSCSYQTPQVGGSFVLTDDYDVNETDSGYTLICNSATPFTLTLPAVLPVLPNPEGIWNVKIKNVGSGAVTVDPNGLNLDASGSTVSLAHNSGFEISHDGTDYWSSGNYSPSVKSVQGLAAIGTINSSNQAFTLSTSATIFALVWNGQVRFDFTQSSPPSTSFSTTFTPDTNDTLYAIAWT